MRPNPHGDLEAGAWDGNVKAGREGGQKPRWQSHREPPDRTWGSAKAPGTESCKDGLDLLRVANTDGGPGEDITNHSKEKNTS